MTELSGRNFGVLIAFLIPGLVAVWGLSYFSETAKTWLTVAPEQSPTIAGFLYLTIAAAAGGVTVSAVRWAVIDTAHHLTGLRQPNWDFAAYDTKRESFDSIVDDHYRYYQFYANMSVAVAFLYVAHLLGPATTSADSPWLPWGLLVTEVIFLAGSRDSLRKYYSRGTSLLGERKSTRKKSRT